VIGAEFILVSRPKKPQQTCCAAVKHNFSIAYHESAMAATFNTLVRAG
jgi:hypothetical protein